MSGRKKILVVEDADIPVVILTADGHGEEKKHRLGAKADLKKPLDIDAIIEVVKKCCL